MYRSEPEEALVRKNTTRKMVITDGIFPTEFIPSEICALPTEFSDGLNSVGKVCITDGFYRRILIPSEKCELPTDFTDGFEFRRKSLNYRRILPTESNPWEKIELMS